MADTIITDFTPVSQDNNIVTDFKPIRDASLSESAIMSYNTNPDQQAANNLKAVELDIPKAFSTPAMGKANLGDMNNKITAFKEQEGTTTGKFLSNPETAKIAHDDINNLAKLDTYFRNFNVGKLVSDTAAVTASTATGMLAFALSGYSGAIAPIFGGDAEEVLIKTQEALTYTPSTETAQESMEILGKAMSIFPFAGSGWKGIVEGLTTLDLQNAVDVIEGRSGGSNILVPIAGTLGEASAMFGLPEVINTTRTHITNIVDTAKASKVRQRDINTYKEFVEDASKDHPPIDMPIEKVDEILTKAEKTPEEALSDPVEFYERKFQGEKAEVPVTDLTEMVDSIKPEDINDMSMGDIPSVNDIKRQAEIKKATELEKPKEGIQVGEAAEGTTRVPSAAKRAETDAIAKKLTEGFDDLQKVDIESAKKWAEDAQGILDKDYAQAKRIAMGKEPAPEGIRVGAVFEAVKIRALLDGDINTIQQLASESTVSKVAVELGREIKAFDSKLEHDPIRDAQEVVKVRTEKATKTGKKAANEKALNDANKKTNAAKKELDKHIDKTSQEKIKTFIKEYQDVIGKRQTRKNVRKVDKVALDAEFSALSSELNKILSPNKLTSGIDPTAIPVLVKMAKNRIESGIITVEGVIDSIHFEVQGILEGVSKREIRDAISGYGKTSKMSQEELQVQLRELKRQARLVSALEDAEAGQAPLRSGLQRDAVSNEVRQLQKQVQQKMKETGVKTESPEQQMKTSLDAVKTRLRNQITDLTRQIETGEKTPKKQGVKYDEEANALKAERDILKKALEDIVGKPEITDEQRIKVATSAVERSIKEYERRIKEKELVTPKRESKTPETPELKALREQRDALKSELDQMKKDAKPPKDPEAIRLKSYKTRLANDISKIETKLDKGDFEKTGRQAINLDETGKKLKSEYDRLRNDYKNLSDISGITKNEIKTLVDLSKDVAKTKEIMEQGGSRLAYGSAKVKYENYVGELKGANDPIATMLKDRAGEFKTTFEENRTRAIVDVGIDSIRTISNNSVALVATLDNSFVGRQGIKTLMTHPSAWYPGMVNSFADFIKTIGGKQTFDALKADVYSRPNFLDGKYSKADIIAKVEEQFPDNLPGRIPVVGRVFKASEAAFTGSALRMRVDLFDLFEKTARENGVNTNSPKWLEDAGKLTNSLTARGSLGKKGTPKAVSLILWAPKMLKANLDVLTGHGFGYGFNTNWAKKQAASNILKIVAETATIMAIANALSPGSAETDPTSTDFGKIKIGDTRFDITGGAASIVTLAARMLTNSYKSTSTGLSTKYGPEFGQTSKFDALITFMANKVTPPVGVINQWLKGETREGDDVTLGTSLYSAGVPISARNFIELDKADGADALAGAIVDLVGISANTYRDAGNQTRHIIARIREDVPLTPEQAKIYMNMTERQKNYIDKEASMTAMQAGFSHLNIEGKIFAWSNATLAEREELSEIYNKHISYHIKNNIIDQSELDEFYDKIDKAEK